MASQKDNLKALAALGITVGGSTVEGILPLKGDESASQVAAILKAAKAAIKPAQGSSQSAASTEGTVLVWVKGKTYINDTERVNPGFYRLPVPLPVRLSKSPTSVVEVFEDAIPPRKMTEIAKWSGVAHPEDYQDDELLAKIGLTVWKPF